MTRYYLDFILSAKNTSSDVIKNALVEFGRDLEVLSLENAQADNPEYKVNINTEDPTIIFDTCGQFGRMKAIKIEERKE